MVELSIKAFIIGFCVAAPLGPCGLLCISRSIQHGFGTGFTTGLGVVLADLLYAAIAAFGVAALVGWLEEWSVPLRIFGSLFLIGIGCKIAFSTPSLCKKQPQDTFSSAFLITLANPLTVLAFIAIFASFDLGYLDSIFDSIILVLGVGLGALAWWVLLSWLASHFGSRLGGPITTRTSHFSGWLIVLAGLIALVVAVRLI